MSVQGSLEGDAPIQGEPQDAPLIMDALDAPDAPGSHEPSEGPTPDTSKQEKRIPDIVESTPQPSVKGKRLLPDQNLEERLNIKDLEALQDAFMHDGDGYDNKLSLTKEQFTEALMLILNKGTRDEYSDLFDKIDVTKEGTVDWDKFASHMLLDFYELDDKVKSTQVPQWKNLKILQAPHKEIVQRIVYLKNTNRYISISKEGSVAMWAPSVRLMRTIKTTTESCRPRDLWVTDFICLQNLNKIALAFTSKEVAIYDLSSKMEFNCQYKIYALQHTPLCLDYWADPENPNLALLSWGDSNGQVNVVSFSSANIALFERPIGAGGDAQETTLNIALKDVIKGKYRGSSYSRHTGHSGWVRQVMYVEDLECFISCATTWQDSIVIGWLEKNSLADDTRVNMKTTTVQISQGVNAFDYTGKLNLIASAGVNHHVLLWNPYVVSKPNGVLRGHMAAVVQVKFNEARGQLISFSKDKVLRIWDVQLQVCIQRLAETFPKGPEVHSILLFHEEKNRLFITFNYMMTLLEMKTEKRDRVLSHDKPVVSALFNPAYNQVVTAGQDGLIVVWLVDTGQKVKQFNSGHTNAEVTNLAQDVTQNRIYTAATDGTVKVWDMNGHCYHMLTCGGGNPADIGQVLPLKRSLVTIGWSRHVTIFRNSMMRDYHVEPGEWKGGQEHQDDILAAAFDPPTILATGSYDGEIIIWNTNSEQPSRRLSQRTRRRFMKSRGKFVSREPTNLYGPPQKQEEDRGYDSHKDTRENSNVRPKSRAASRISAGDNDENNEFGFAISRLCFLEARKNRSATGGANLVSCGGNGWVRFWNTQASKLVAEFVAHKHSGSIIMTIDKENQFLITGDVDGMVKIWSIQHYCLYKPENDDVITLAPPIQAQYHAHNDMITAIDTCEREERLLIITASLDQSVALTDIYGTQIGIFGQEEHWKIEPYVPPIEEDVPEEEEEEEFSEVVIEDEGESTWEPDPQATENPQDYRISTWDSTLLGKSYQELRVQKRERKQPSTIPNLPYLHADRVGVPPAGPHAALETSGLCDPLPFLKPDFIANPEKYFKNPDDEIVSKVPKSAARLPQLAETLRAAFDEKSLFPKYILDFESKMRQEHASNVAIIQSKTTKSRGPSMAQVNFQTPASRQTSPKGGRRHRKSEVAGF